MSHLRYLCLFAYSSVQHMLCFVLVLFVFILCTLCCQFLWIVIFDCPFSILYRLFILRSSCKIDTNRGFLHTLYCYGF